MCKDKHSNQAFRYQASPSDDKTHCHQFIFFTEHEVSPFINVNKIRNLNLQITGTYNLQ